MIPVFFSLPRERLTGNVDIHGSYLPDGGGLWPPDESVLVPKHVVVKQMLLLCFWPRTVMKKI